MQCIEVDDHGTQLSYIDSGVPNAAGTPHEYITIFAVHGTVFTSPIYGKVMAASKEAGLRFVAINRRDYPGSSPFSADDGRVLAEGSDDERDEFVKSRGRELATFITRFIALKNIPAISKDGKGGGCGILGWSLGNAIALAAVGILDTLPSDAKAQFGSYLRGLILHEPPTVSLGTDLPPKAWSPQIDSTIPAELRGPFFAQWITSYFKHGDLSTRNLDELCYVVPTTTKVPSIFSMSDEQQAEIVCHPPGVTSDMPFMVLFNPQLNASYKRACFGKSIRETVPQMRVTVLFGDAAPWPCFPAVWQMQSDSAASGGDGQVHFKRVNGINHFVHWDDPVLSVKLYLEALL